MNFGSLFSGIGGIDLGLERAGMQCRWQVEIDPYCTRVLAKHWPDVPRYSDIRELSGEELEPVDLICGGFPCQPHSLAGKRLASADDRDLWGEFARLIRRVRPRWVLAENVPGILSSESGRFFGRVLGDLAGLGYDAEWESLPAAAFGAPHIRERVFIVAHADSRCIDASRKGLITPAGDGTADWAERCCSVMAHAEGQPGPLRQAAGGRPGGLTGGGAVFSHPDRKQVGRIAESRGQRGEWAVEPDICRVANGVPARVDRLRGLGNAVVPQVAEWIGRRIMMAATRQ